jgi:predicted dehydrogenase
MKKHKAAIVGLGQVGLLFDEDPKRIGVWTHFTAYERLANRYELIAVCDCVASRCSMAAKRSPAIRCYEHLEEMLAAESIDVISLCTPPAVHAEQILACAGKVRAIICEKPLSHELDAGQKAIKACMAQDTVLAVNYYKRYDGCIPHVIKRLKAGDIGILRTATAWYSGPLDAVGSHVVDLLRYLLGPLNIKSLVALGPERHITILTGDGNSLIIINSTASREDFIFEIDLLGSEGRIRILDNGSHAEFYRFEDSLQYGGYKELFREPTRGHVSNERFLPLFTAVADRLDGIIGDPLVSDGVSAFESQILINEIKEKVEKNIWLIS